MTTIHSPRILLDSIHFNDIRNNIRSRSVAWDALARSAEIPEYDASIVKKIESVLVKNINSGELIDILTYLPVLLYLLQNEHSLDIRKYVINLVAELIISDSYHDETIKFFYKDHQNLKLLFELTLSSDDLDDDVFVLISLFVLVSLLIELEDRSLVEEILKNKKFISIFQNTDRLDTTYICIRFLQELCALKSYKILVWNHQSTFIPTLFRVLEPTEGSYTAGISLASSTTNNLIIQLQYYSLLTLWLLTFDHKISEGLVNIYLFEFLKLLKLIKVTIKEKITRLSISIILNCVSPNVKTFKLTIKNLLLLGSALPILQQLSDRKYSDEELREDLSNLKAILEIEYKQLTSFDEYLAELNSKKLIWSPPHISNTFWTENSTKFKENNWKLVKCLVEICNNFKTSNDPDEKVSLAVALNDLTHVIELEPDCISILNMINGKIMIMELLSHNDSKIKYEALKTTQALISYALK